MSLLGDFHVHTEPPSVRVTACGEMDAFAAPQMVTPVYEAFAAGCRHVRLDLSNVTFIDAGGVGQLIRLYNLAHEANGTLTIDAASTCVRRVCTLVGVEKTLGVEPIGLPLSARRSVRVETHQPASPTSAAPADSDNRLASPDCDRLRGGRIT